MEFCTTYDAKYVPNKDNFKKMVEQIANEEILQKPLFLKECISLYLNDIKDILDIDYIFKSYLQTDKNLIAQLKIEENITHEKKNNFSVLKEIH